MGLRRRKFEKESEGSGVLEAGEGRNIIVGGGASARVASGLTLSAGGSYSFRDDYISAHAVDVGGRLTYDPGDQLAVVAGLTYEQRDWLFTFNTSYRTEETTSSSGPFIGPAWFTLGDTFSIDGAMRHAWSDQHATTLFVAFTRITDNDHVEGLPPFDFAYETENSDVYEVALSHDYRVLPWLGLFGRISVRERPGDEDDLLVHRTRWAGEGGFDVRASDKISGRVSLGWLHVEDHETFFSDKVETEGWYGSFSTALRW